KSGHPDWHGGNRVSPVGPLLLVATTRGGAAPFAGQSPASAAGAGYPFVGRRSRAARRAKRDRLGRRLTSPSPPARSFPPPRGFSAGLLFPPRSVLLASRGVARFPVDRTHSTALSQGRVSTIPIIVAETSAPEAIIGPGSAIPAIAPQSARPIGISPKLPKKS